MVDDRRRERWTEHRQHRRAAFVDAGVAAIDARGPATSAEEIAAAAGVSRTVLYRYFRDKGDLHLAVAGRAIELLVQDVTPPLRAGTTPHEVIRGGVGACMRWLDAHPDLYRFLRQRPPGQLDTAAATVDEQLARLLTEVLTRFGIAADDAEPRAYSIIGLLENGGEWWLTRRATSAVSGMSIEQFTDLMCEEIWYVIDGTLRSLGLNVEADAPLPALAGAPNQ